MADTYKSDIQNALASYDAAVANAEKTIAMAQNSGNASAVKEAQGYLNQLLDLGPTIDTLSKAASSAGTYTGAYNQEIADVINATRSASSMSSTTRGEYGADYGGIKQDVYAREADVAGFAGNMSDAYWQSTGGTGISNTGKKYINGKLATNDEWSNFISIGNDLRLGAGGGGGSAGSAGGVGGYNAQGNPTPGGQYNAQGQFVGTSTNEFAGAVGTPEQIAERKSAYDLLYQQFNQYGLGALVEPLKNLVLENVSPSEFTLRLRETDAYKKRFAANAARTQKGLSALSEAEYIALEDQYQSIMRNYGLPESYYARGDMGRQQGFEKFIAGDVSAVELEDRIQLAQNRVINAAPEIAASLRQYYPDITNGDILAYALDPEKALNEIRRKVTAAEIGGAAAMAGLTTGVTRAEELARYGVTGEAARQGFQTVAEVAPRGGQLAEFYKQTPYTQTTAEQEVFGLGGATEATKQRKKLTQLEQASFSGQAGITGGALARERAGSF